MQERLSERELLTRVAVGLIRSAQPLHPNALQPLRTSIYAFKTDFVLATWVANITPADIARAEQFLSESGYTRPTVRNVDDTAVGGNLPPRFNVLMEVEPRTPETLALPGRILDRAQILGPTIVAALAIRAPAASEPAILPRSDGHAGIMLAAPVFAENGGPLTGFITFSYRLGPLMLGNDEPSLFNVTLRDPRNEQLEFASDRNGNVGQPTAVLARANSAGAARRLVRWSRLRAELLRQGRSDGSCPVARRDRDDRRRRVDKHPVRPVRLRRLQ